MACLSLCTSPTSHEPPLHLTDIILDPGTNGGYDGDADDEEDESTADSDTDSDSDTRTDDASFVDFVSRSDTLARRRAGRWGLPHSNGGSDSSDNQSNLSASASELDLPSFLMTPKTRDPEVDTDVGLETPDPDYIPYPLRVPSNDPLGDPRRRRSGSPDSDDQGILLDPAPEPQRNRIPCSPVLRDMDVDVIMDSELEAPDDNDIEEAADRDYIPYPLRIPSNDHLEEPVRRRAQRLRSPDSVGSSGDSESQSNLSTSAPPDPIPYFLRAPASSDDSDDPRTPYSRSSTTRKRLVSVLSFTVGCSSLSSSLGCSSEPSRGISTGVYMS